MGCGKGAQSHLRCTRLSPTTLKATRSQRWMTSCSSQSKYADNIMRHNVDSTFKTDNCVIRILSQPIWTPTRRHPDITCGPPNPQSSIHRILERPPNWPQSLKVSRLLSSTHPEDVFSLPSHGHTHVLWMDVSQHYRMTLLRTNN